MRLVHHCCVRACRDCQERFILTTRSGEVARGIDLARAEPGDICDSCGCTVLGTGRPRDLRQRPEVWTVNA